MFCGNPTLRTRNSRWGKYIYQINSSFHAALYFWNHSDVYVERTWLSIICVWLKEPLGEIIKPRYSILLTDSKLSLSYFHWNETGRLPLRKTTMRDFVVINVNFHRSQYFCNSFISLCNPVGVHWRSQHHLHIGVGIFSCHSPLRLHRISHVIFHIINIDSKENRWRAFPLPYA